MAPLRFKKPIKFKSGKTYSVCLRGARRFDVSDEYHLSLYNPNSWDGETEKPDIANIISQNHYLFTDLNTSDYEDNYDLLARDKIGLFNAMREVYPDFEKREIVTILRFKVF